MSSLGAHGADLTADGRGDVSCSPIPHRHAIDACKALRLLVALTGWSGVSHPLLLLAEGPLFSYLISTMDC